MFSGVELFNKLLFKLINLKVIDVLYMFYGVKEFNDFLVL